MKVEMHGTLLFLLKLELKNQNWEKSRYIVQGERKALQIESPRGDKIASIDMGIKVLVSVIVNDTWILYKGFRAKQDYFYFMRQVSQLQSMADKARNLGEYEMYKEPSKETLHGMGFLRSIWATLSTSPRIGATSSLQTCGPTAN